MSSDTIDDASDDDHQNYPIEFLHELTPSGMPVHKMNLKIGTIVMLLRNLNTKKGYAMELGYLSKISNLI